MLDLFLFFSVLHFVKISWKVKILVSISHLLGCLSILNVRLFQLSPFSNLMPGSTVSISGNWAKTCNQVNNYPKLSYFQTRMISNDHLSSVASSLIASSSGRGHTGYYSFYFCPRMLSCSSAGLLTACRKSGLMEWLSSRERRKTISTWKKWAQQSTKLRLSMNWHLYKLLYRRRAASPNARAHRFFFF